MNTYNFIYTVDSVEQQTEVQANNNIEAWEIIERMVPKASKIILVK